MSHILTPQQTAALSASPLLRGIAPEEFPVLLAQPGCTLEQFPAGDSIYRPDRFRRCLGILLSGQVRVTNPGLTVSVLQPGALFGAAALYNDAPDYATTLTTLSPCTVVMLTQQLLDQLIAQHPTLRENYLRYLSGRIRFLSTRLQGLTSGGAEEKLCRYLLDNLDNGTLVCSAAELSRRLGISRASLYRAFESLERSGLILRQGKTITVPDSAALSGAV